MRCFECRYLDRSKVLTCYPPKYYCTYDKTTHFADDECKYEHYPIVRCKDCRYYWGNLSEDDTDEMYGECRWDNDEMPNDDDFCSYGERAEQTDNKLSGYEEVIEALDNLKLEFTIHGTERVKRMVGDDHE